MPLTPNSAALAYLASQTGMPRPRFPDGQTIDQPHPEWVLFRLPWRWLLDSWEEGEAYRMAFYGSDIHGMPVRNLIRHKREYPCSFDANYSLQTGGLWVPIRRTRQPTTITNCAAPVPRCPPSLPRGQRPIWRESVAGKPIATAPTGCSPGLYTHLYPCTIYIHGCL